MEIMKFIKIMVRVPLLSVILAKDIYLWIRRKGWLEFTGFGLHLHVGDFGQGKTSYIVCKALGLAKSYKQMQILTNIDLFGFPSYTKITKLTKMKQIMECDPQTLILISEIGTLFNSRDFAVSRESVPKILFQHICQNRKLNKMILCDDSRYESLDVQLRRILRTVTVCNMYFNHPFSRLWINYVYKGRDYERCVIAPGLEIQPQEIIVKIQTDLMRTNYDTNEMVCDLLKMDYVDPVASEPVFSLAGLEVKQKVVKRNLKKLH